MFGNMNEINHFGLVSFGCEDFSGINENAEMGQCVGKEDNDLGYQTTKRACRFECQKYGSIHGYGCCELRPDNINDPEKGSCHYFVDGHEEYGKNYLTMKCTQGGYLLFFDITPNIL